ncbi:GAF and ANTAR domain-containing protein [Streptomyces sp. TRM72054]|uniref:GAF and ANTAR domain-containing protein n=1 Tax=Streptomyces sp. TRM72054 TaxID=2870562 RepID=UPI001C8BD090|nr:GAF and ANTAR domain-containing protein [Streptomyces sp. TRM72054]MBX9396412.1 GAF and ANTAR domain-containing protein [Streptomyces sp. TRM72054]
MRPRDEPERARAAEAIADGVRDAEPGEIPRRLCHVAVRLLPVARASVSLCHEGMPVPLSASDDRAAYLMEVQATLGEGPCLHAARTGTPVIASDLAGGRDADRWPVFAQEATALGVRAVYALPLGDDAGCLGTLDLYRDVPGMLSPRDLRTAYLVAGVMTVALMALPTGEENGGRSSDGLWLSDLATEHDEVYQAIGMVMAQLGVGSDEALARLRGHAFARGRTVLDVAHDVVAHRERFERD